MRFKPKSPRDLERKGPKYHPLGQDHYAAPTGKVISSPELQPGKGHPVAGKVAVKTFRDNGKSNTY